MKKRFIAYVLIAAAAAGTVHFAGEKLLPPLVFTKSARLSTTAFEAFDKAALSPDGRHVARFAKDGKGLLLDAIGADGRLSPVMKIEVDFSPEGGKGLDINWSAGGTSVAASGPSLIVVADPASGFSQVIDPGKLLSSFNAWEEKKVYHAFVSDGAGYLAVNSTGISFGDGVLLARSGSSWSVVRTFNIVGSLEDLAFSRDGKHLLLYTGTGCRIEETATAKEIGDGYKVFGRTLGTFDMFRAAASDTRLFFGTNNEILEYNFAEGKGRAVPFRGAAAVSYDAKRKNLLSLDKKGVLASHVLPLNTAAKPEEFTLSLDPAYRGGPEFASKEYMRYTTFDSIPENAVWLGGMAARSDGNVALCLYRSGKGLTYRKNVSYTIDVIDYDAAAAYSPERFAALRRRLLALAVGAAAAVALLLETLFGLGRLKAAFAASKRRRAYEQAAAAAVEEEKRRGILPQFEKLGLDKRKELDAVLAILNRSMDAKNFILEIPELGFALDEENQLGAFFKKGTSWIAVKAGKDFRIVSLVYAPNGGDPFSHIVIVEDLGGGDSKLLYKGVYAGS